MKKQTRIISLLIVIFFVLVALRLTLFKPTREMRVSAKRAVEKISVKVMTLKREDLDLVLSYIGNIKAKDEINVFSKVTGKLAEYTLNEGDKVEKGQTIALVDRDETGLKYELARVESPISGILGKTLLDKGANILPSAGLSSGTALAIVVNMEEMIVRLDIPEADIPYVKKGLKSLLKVDAYPEENFQGEVTKVSEVVDPATRTLPIEITIPNPDHRLKSGMFARIRIIASQLKERLVILQDGLVQELGVSYVFVVEDHTAKKKKVTLGVKEDNKVEILEGLKEGQKVIIFGQQGLKDGSSVEIADGI